MKVKADAPDMNIGGGIGGGFGIGGGVKTPDVDIEGPKIGGGFGFGGSGPKIGLLFLILNIRFSKHNRLVHK